MEGSYTWEGDSRLSFAAPFTLEGHAISGFCHYDDARNRAPSKSKVFAASKLSFVVLSNLPPSQVASDTPAQHCL